jgi:hypothetical protein
MKCVEENPHLVRRIGEPAVGKSVPGQQVAELIMNFWKRNWDQREDTEANNKDSRGDHKKGCTLVAG